MYHSPTKQKSCHRQTALVSNQQRPIIAGNYCHSKVSRSCLWLRRPSLVMMCLSNARSQASGITLGYLCGVKVTGDSLHITYFYEYKPFVSRQRKQLWIWNKHQNVADKVIKTASIPLKAPHYQPSQARVTIVKHTCIKFCSNRRLLVYYLLCSYYVLTLL